MNVGGNKNLADFFKDYDLNDEAMSTKYKTKAAEYYRLRVYIFNQNYLFISWEICVKELYFRMKNQIIVKGEKWFKK